MSFAPAAVLLAASLCAFAAAGSANFRDGRSPLSENPARGAAPGEWHALAKSGNAAGSPVGFCSWLWNIGEFSGGNVYDGNPPPACIGGEDMPLTPDAVAAVSNTLVNARANGAVMVVRFGYTGGSETGAEPTEFSTILGHVSQLGKVLGAFPEVVQAVECGMVGPWGEMHSNNYREPQHVRALANAWLETLSTNTALLVRYPMWVLEFADKDVDVFMREVADGTYCANQPGQGRLGLFNDGYLGSATDYGTWRSGSRWMVRAQGVEYLEARWNVPYGGELAHLTEAEADAVESDLLDASKYNVVQEFYRTHLSYLRNIDSKSHLLAARLEKFRLSHDHDFEGMPDLSEWYGVGLRDFVRAHMGYRFVVRGVGFSGGGASVTIENTGFGHLLAKSRGEVSSGESSCAADLDLRGLSPGERRTYSLPLPGGTTSGEPVMLTLRLDTAAAQAVRFANDSMRVGDAVCLRGVGRILGGVGNTADVGSGSSPVAWGTAENWTPAGVPCGMDAVNWAPSKTGSHRTAHVSLEGDCAVGYVTNKWRSLDLRRAASCDTPVTFAVCGQLGNVGYQRHSVNDGVTLEIPEGARFVTGRDDSNASTLTLESGSRAVISGDVESHKMEYVVKAGAVLQFDASSYTLKSQTSGDYVDRFTASGGTVVFGRGLSVAADSTSESRGNVQRIDHSGGTVVFCGDFSSSLPWAYEWSGGLLSASNDCTFGANVTLSVPASAEIALDVADGRTLSVQTLAADSTAVIAKAGGGVFAFPPTTAGIVVNGGSVGLASAASYDLGNVTLGAGVPANIALVAMGARIDSLPAAFAGATFSADLSGAAAGTVVLYSSDAAILGAARASIAVPDGFELRVDGEMLTLESSASHVFAGDGDLLSGDCWGGALPPAGAVVSITGALTVATLSHGSFPAWGSVEVRDGATLRISVDAALPPVRLNKSARLEVDSGATASVSGDFAGVATASQVPVLSVASGATLAVPGGMRFSNVDIDLRGTISVSPAGTLTIGHAAAGETTYIGFRSVGGRILNGVVEGYDRCRIGMCCPDAGGRVEAISPLVFGDMPEIGVNLPSHGDNYWNGLSLGVGNPESAAFEVVFDNARWNPSGNLYVKGGATFRLANGSSYANGESYSLYNRHAEVSGCGRIVVEGGSELRLDAMGNSGDNAAVTSASEAGRETIVVADGGIYDNYRTTGNGNGVFAASNAVVRIHVPFIDEDVSGSSGTRHYCSTNVLFEGLSSVRLAEGAALVLTTRNSESGESRFSDESGDRVVAVADVPMTGGGSLALSNANANAFGVVVKSGANTATGTARVVGPAEGVGATTLYFANGANWAGTVVADGNVALTNLVDASAAATNTFGALRLDAAFGVRVWKSGGRIVACDSLNVGSFSGNGRITPMLVGGEAAPDDSFMLGRIPKGAGLPRVARGWSAAAEPIDGESDVLVLTYGRGCRVILR